MMHSVSSERVIEVLADSDEEFQSLCAVLYGPDVTVADVYDDVFGVAKAAKTLAPDEAKALKRIEMASQLLDSVTKRPLKLKPISKGLVSTALRGTGTSLKELVAGAREGMKAVPVKAQQMTMDLGPTPQNAERLSRGKAVGAALRKPHLALARHPGRTAAGALVTGAAVEHRRANRPVQYEDAYYGKLDDRRRRQLTAGASAAGAVAGGLGLAVGAKDLLGHAGEYAAKTGVKRLSRKALSAGFKAQKPLHRALIPVEAVGLGGEISATHILHGDTKRPKAPVAKGDLYAEGTFSKFDEDKRLAFGWASVIKKDGMDVVDRQGDWIHPEDLEDAAYRYVLSSRIGGDMHKRAGDNPHHVSDLVESIVFTDEKIAKLGLPDDFPRGWWVGFKVHDEETWQQVKKGGRTGFSIHGRGKRTPYDLGF